MPLLDLFWTILMVFLFVAWIWVLVAVITDLFRSDSSGWAKAGWALFMVLIPWLGVLAYLIAHGDDMQRRSAAVAAAADQAQRDYIRNVAGAPVSTGDELAKLSNLRDAGVITDAEFQIEKDKVLH